MKKPTPVNFQLSLEALNAHGLSDEKIAKLANTCVGVKTYKQLIWDIRKGRSKAPSHALGEAIRWACFHEGVPVVYVSD